MQPGGLYFTHHSISMADTDTVMETATASEGKPGKAAASASDAPASEPRARRERKQSDFYTPDGPKGDGQKRVILEVCFHTPSLSA